MKKHKESLAEWHGEKLKLLALLPVLDDKLESKAWKEDRRRDLYVCLDSVIQLEKMYTQIVAEYEARLYAGDCALHLTQHTVKHSDDSDSTADGCISFEVAFNIGAVFTV